VIGSHGSGWHRCADRNGNKVKVQLFELREGTAMAIDAVRQNKLRSFLTILGVLIGVASVIGMVSIIQGLNDSMASQIEALGSNVIYVSKYEPGIHMGHRSEAERNRPDITYDDAMAILELAPAVGGVAPQNFRPGMVTIKYGREETTRMRLFGTTTDYPSVNSAVVARGRFFTESEDIYKAFVCVLGSDPAEALFPNTDPIGKEVLIINHRFVVVGVMEEKQGILGDNPNNFVALPFGTFMRLHPQEKALWLAVQSVSSEVMPLAKDQIVHVMRRRHGLTYDKPNDFAVFTQETLMRTYEQITQGIYLAMVVISSIGLMVGGVGVMNIMLVSVTERTREIGVRKAIGARRKNIVWQFLVEAMTLSGLGGLLGILVGLGLGALVGTLTPLPASVSFVWIGIGFSVGVGVGLVFGIYPAYRAARVDPIVSLRYE
jgi:putative ABC transport system permease protein